MICPKCHSKKAKKIDYLGGECLICPDCGYNECDQFDEVPEYKTSQKTKGSFSPYKLGGGKRISR